MGPSTQRMGMLRFPGHQMIPTMVQWWMYQPEVMSPCLTVQQMVDLLLPLFTILIYVASALTSPVLNTTQPLFLLASYSSPKQSCLAMLPLTFSTSPAITFTFIFV